MVTQRLTAEEKKWRAENDAYTLLQVTEIEMDKTRFNAAKKKVKEIIVKKEKELKAAKKVVNVTKKKPAVRRKPAVKRKPTAKRRIIRKTKK